MLMHPKFGHQSQVLHLVSVSGADRVARPWLGVGRIAGKAATKIAAAPAPRALQRVRSANALANAFPRASPGGAITITYSFPLTQYQLSVSSAVKLIT